jgi:hypothetical protein
MLLQRLCGLSWELQLQLTYNFALHCLLQHLWQDPGRPGMILLENCCTFR